MYCSKEFIQNIYRTLAQDREFVDMLRSLWQIELSKQMLSLYRMLVMYRQPLIRTDSGYHVPSSEEVIAGVRAYFDPAHLSGDATPSATDSSNFSRRARDVILNVLKDASTKVTLHFGSPDANGDSDFQGLLLDSIRNYIVLSRPDPSAAPYASLLDRGISSEISEAISRVSTTCDLTDMLSETIRSTISEHYLLTWVSVHLCLENPSAGPACECPYVYFFVKYCLDQGLGVPKLALALYDRMNMQLSREFIRCANPTCELNKLDKSTGKVKFKQCSRCKAVIYCSRECQTAHYPEHKSLCSEHTTG